MEEILQKLTVQYQKNFPFVAYHKPNGSSVKILLQHKDSVFHADDFTEKGFVFAPFDPERENHLIPFVEADFFEILFEVEKPEKSHQKEFPFNTVEKSNHIQLVQKGIDAIKSGELQKVVLSRKQEVEISGQDPFEIFSKLLQTYPEAFVYCWFHPKTGLWVGATPETLLKVESGHLKTMALAGTQKFVKGKEIVWGEKEKEEQQLVTDFLVSELKDKVEDLKISETETVRAGNLVHLKTRVSGKLSEGNLGEIISALHPTPAVCGLPKETAMDFILKNENHDREFYTGFLGELNMDVKRERPANRRNLENQIYSFSSPKTDLYVNLRCMKLENQKAVLYVGGGITKDSDLEKEWEETVDKTQTMLRVL